MILKLFRGFINFNIKLYGNVWDNYCGDMRKNNKFLITIREKVIFAYCSWLSDNSKIFYFLL